MSNDLGHKSIINAGAAVATNVGGFLSTLIVARLIGVEGTGVFAFAIAITALALVLSDFGVLNSLIRYVPELRARGETEEAKRLTWAMLKFYLASNATLFLIFLSVAVTLIVYQSSPFRAIDPAFYLSNPNFWLLLGLICLFYSLANFQFYYLRATQRFRRLAVLSLVSSALQVIVTFFATYYFGIGGSLAAVAVGVLLPALLAVKLVKPKPPIAQVLRNRVVRFTFQIWVAQIFIDLAMTRLEVIFLDLSWGSAAAGLFAVSFTLANIAQLPLLLTGAIVPHLSSQVDADADQRAGVAYEVSLRLLALILFPMCLGLVAITPTLVPALYGQAFADAIPVASLLVTAALFGSLAAITLPFIMARERSQFVLACGAFGALLTLISCITLVPFFGPIGAAFGRIVIHVLLLAAVLWYVSRRLGYVTPFGDLGRILLAGLACALVARLLVEAVPGPLGLFVSIPAGILTYGLAVRRFGALRAADVARLNKAFTMLPQPFRKLAQITIHRLVA